MNKVFKTGVAVAAAALTASVVLPATAVSADFKDCDGWYRRNV
ncbi:hypothetical protein [Weissella sp. LMG 11983]